MLTATGPLAERPTSALISSLAVWHWIASTPAGRVGFLLLAHPAQGQDDSPAKVTSRMHGLAACLGLTECRKPLPDIGPRLFIHEAGAFLRLDGCDYLLHAPVTGRWNEFASAGGTVAVAVGLDSPRAHAPKDLVEAYMTETARMGRLFLGKTRLASPTRADLPVAAEGVDVL